jgi:hypothetical protein
LTETNSARRAVVDPVLNLLPNSEIHALDAGHFAWEQAAEEYGGLVADWVSDGYRRLAAG